jgi:hypothetical protein
LWEEYREEFLKEYPNLNEDALIEAIKWHDSYYVPGDELNEQKSAINFLNFADNSKRSSNEIQLIDLIMSSTRIGYNFDFIAIPELKVMHDLDWSGFNDYEIFKNNCEKIYQEVIDHNPFLKEDESFGQKVRRNQIEFYRKYAETPLYFTKTFSKFNDVARENMLKLANKLEENIKNKKEKIC